MKYSVEITTTLEYVYFETVEADSRKEAAEIAMELASSCDSDDVIHLGEWNHSVEVEDSDDEDDEEED
jgi:hypothetical protein